MPVGMLVSFTMLQVWVFSPPRVRTLPENEVVDRDGIILPIRKSSPDLAA